MPVPRPRRRPLLLLPQPPQPSPRRLSSHRPTRGNLVPGQHIQLSALEDRESVQVALSVVINALATGQLETKRATALLYGLQLASTNAANLDFTPVVSKLAREVEATPDGLDLADPATDEEV